MKKLFYYLSIFLILSTISEVKSNSKKNLKIYPLRVPNILFFDKSDLKKKNSVHAEIMNQENIDDRNKFDIELLEKVFRKDNKNLSLIGKNSKKIILPMYQPDEDPFDYYKKRKFTKLTRLWLEDNLDIYQGDKYSRLRYVTSELMSSKNFVTNLILKVEVK